MKVKEIRYISLECAYCGVRVVFDVKAKVRIPRYCPCCEEEFSRETRQFISLIRGSVDMDFASNIVLISKKEEE